MWSHKDSKQTAHIITCAEVPTPTIVFPSLQQPALRTRASLEKVREIGDIEELTVRQLKEILATNFVDYKGCCEKWELMDRVRRLWEAHQHNSDKGEYQR